MDFETVSPEDFGRSLRGIGMNILVRDVVPSRPLQARGSE